MTWLATLLAALFEAALRVFVGQAKEAKADQGKVDQGRAQVRAEVQSIVTDTADAQAHANQARRAPRAVAERLLREAGVEPGGGKPGPAPHA